ncbi:MAG: aminotransferase class III-fold pyridoxal phosphate-dependent enzyme, partial [Nostoc sp.]
RPGIFSFMGAYHGMTLGSLSISGNTEIRAGAIGTSNNVTFMPYPYGFMESFDTIEFIESVLNDVNSGIEKPAAIIFETVQAEGGIIVAPIEWMQRLRKLCDKHDI